jgi:hypothetical protein
MLFRYFKKSVTWDLYTVHIIQESLFFISPLYSIIQVAIAHQIRGLNGTEFTFLIKYKITKRLPFRILRKLNPTWNYRVDGRIWILHYFLKVCRWHLRLPRFGAIASSHFESLACQYPGMEKAASTTYDIFPKGRFTLLIPYVETGVIAIP